jgi:hypothetical protein
MFQFSREFIINSDIDLKQSANSLCVVGVANYETGVDKHGVKRIMSFIEVDHVAE